MVILEIPVLLVPLVKARERLAGVYSPVVDI